MSAGSCCAIHSLPIPLRVRQWRLGGSASLSTRAVGCLPARPDRQATSWHLALYWQLRGRVGFEASLGLQLATGAGHRDWRVRSESVARVSLC